MPLRYLSAPLTLNPSLSSDFPQNAPGLLQDQGLLILCFDRLSILEAVTSGLAPLTGFFSPKYEVLWKCQKQHFLHGIYLKRKGKDYNRRLCPLPSQSQKLSSHHLVHYPEPCGHWFVLPTRKDIFALGCLCITWFKFLTHINLFFFFFNLQNWFGKSFGDLELWKGAVRENLCIYFCRFP